MQYDERLLDQARDIIAAELDLEHRDQLPARVSPADAAAALGTTTGVLAVWRCTRRHSIEYYKVGTKVWYPTRALAEFIAANTHDRVAA